jgi:hypothetical protein
MVRTLAVLAALLGLAGSAGAIPVGEAEYGAVPIRDYRHTDEQCRLAYYNICSGWQSYRVTYCFGAFDYAPLPVKYGTCFVLSDCPGECRHLEDVWWACKHFCYWGSVDVEIFCADEQACPLGPPLAGIYGAWLSSSPWQHFTFGSVALCPCEDTGTGKFIVMITEYPESYHGGRCFAPYTDINLRNIIDGCETEWRCEGHSYVYRNAVSYCDLYGAPGALWVSCGIPGRPPCPGQACTECPAIPVGCFNYWSDTGFYAEWLIDCYVACQGPTRVEKETWSSVKGLYR